MTRAAQTPFEGLGLVWHPVAIAFLPKPPADLQRLERPLPAGCAYWRHASEGHSFYTLPDDHVNCPIGAHTHNVPMTPGKQAELQSLVGTMIELQYLSIDEIALIPRRRDPLAVAAYAPLDRATFTPEVVIVRGNARQMMLVAEATRAAGVFDRADIMGRPACSMIPFASTSGNAVASFGCIGNRVYTGLDDTEMYVTIPGTALSATLDKLAVILEANRVMEAFYRERQTALS